MQDLHSPPSPYSLQSHPHMASQKQLTYGLKLNRDKTELLFTIEDEISSSPAARNIGVVLDDQLVLQCQHHLCGLIL